MPRHHDVRTLAQWGWVGLFATIIAALYVVRGRKLLRQALETDEPAKAQ